MGLLGSVPVQSLVQIQVAQRQELGSSLMGEKDQGNLQEVQDENGLAEA